MFKVLIIDDNRKSVEIMNDFVHSWGYETILAYQGMEALVKAFQEKADVILLDVMLPGMSGFEICQTLKDSRETKNIPVVMITALASPEDRVNGFSAGAHNFLSKPVNYKELRAVLKNLMDKKQYLDNVEEGHKVIDKIYMMLQHISDNSNLAESENVDDATVRRINYLRCTEEDIYKIIQVMRFCDLYEDVVKTETRREFVQKLFEGLHCSIWLLPLLEYCCKNYGVENERLAATIKELHLQEIADSCYLLKRFKALCKEHDGDSSKILDVFGAEKVKYAYPEKIAAALEQEMIDGELRATLDL